MFEQENGMTCNEMVSYLKSINICKAYETITKQVINRPPRPKTDSRSN